ENPIPPKVERGDGVARAAAEIALRGLERPSGFASALAFAVECERARSEPIAARAARMLQGMRGADRGWLLVFALGVAVVGLVAFVARHALEVRRLDDGARRFEAAREAARRGADANAVAAEVDAALAALGEDEPRLLEAGRLLLAAGDVAGARARLTRA